MNKIDALWWYVTCISLDKYVNAQILMIRETVFFPLDYNRLRKKCAS